MMGDDSPVGEEDGLGDEHGVGGGAAEELVPADEEVQALLPEHERLAYPPHLTITRDRVDGLGCER